MPDTRTPQQTAKDINNFLRYLKQIRLPFEEAVDKILEFVRRSRKIHETVGTRGKKTGNNVYDGAALGALNIYADGMYGYICSPQLDPFWHSYSLPSILQFAHSSGMRRWAGKRMDDVPEVAQWLEDVRDVSKNAFAISNFYAVVPQFIRDGAGPGTADLYCEYDRAHGKMVFTPLHFREFFIAEDQYGRVDTLFRRYPLTYRQLVQKFGMEKLKKVDPTFEQKYERNPYAEQWMIHAVYPRSDREYGKLDNNNMPFASCWLIEGKQDILDESGFEEFPHVCWRYRKETDEWYGRSPAWDAYTEIMTGNQEAKSNLIAGQAIAEPPLVALANLKGKVMRQAKGFTYVDRMDQAPQPLNTGVNLPYVIEMRERTRKAIEKHFNVEFFMMLSQAAYNKIELTATQVIQMAGEKAAIIATRTDTLNIEAFNPLIDIVFNNEWREGRIPAPPQILQDAAQNGIKLEVDFMGPLAQAQKALFQTQGIRAGIEIGAQIGQVSPQSLEVIDWDEAMRIAMKGVSFPTRAIKTQEVINAIRDAKVKQMQQQQAIAGATQVAKALPAAGKDVGANSPLALIMGGMGGK